MNVTRPDGTVVTIPVPPSASLEKTAKIGESLADLPHGVKEARMFDLVHRGGELDYQRPGGVSLKGEFQPFSSYNYGVLAATAGYSDFDAAAAAAAGLYNLTGTGDKSGPHFNNPGD